MRFPYGNAHREAGERNFWSRPLLGSRRHPFSSLISSGSTTLMWNRNSPPNAVSFLGVESAIGTSRRAEVN